MKTALITGVTGQDGSFLAELLLSKKYAVHGLLRRGSEEPQRIKELLPNIISHYGDLITDIDLAVLLDRIKPDEIYNLGGQSDVKVSFECPEYTALSTGVGALHLLQAVLQFSPKSKVYQASSSEMFGNSPGPQNETTPMEPCSPYGASKLFAHNMVKIYRQSYGLFACNGILFNHESERRGLRFVTRKISHAAAMIALRKQNSLSLGNIDALRDWGYAKDYVEAMWLMLQQDKPDDYVIGTGVAYSVKDFAKAAFDCVDLDYREYVKIDDSLKRPLEVNHLLADARKAENILGWRPKVSFDELVRIMVGADLMKNTDVVIKETEAA